MTDSDRFPTSFITRCIPQIPESVKKCLLTTDSTIERIDNDYAYLKAGGKMRLGRAIKKWCGFGTGIERIISTPIEDYNRWKDKFVIWDSVPKAINEALRRAEKLDEDKHLRSIAGVYKSQLRDDIEYVISRAPEDIFRKTEGQSWGKQSCEAVGREYGKPRRWLRDGLDCGWCSDIEHGNAILYARYTEDGEWIGRQMLRWCQIDNKGTIGLGIEKRWYGEQLIDSLHQEKDDLLRRIAQNHDLPINFHKCVTPYIYAGYSDSAGGGNRLLEYESFDFDQDPLIGKMKEILPDRLEDLADYGGGEIWLYSLDNEGELTNIGQRYTSDDTTPAPDEIAYIIIDMDNFKDATINLKALAKPLINAMIKAVEPKSFGDSLVNPTMVFNNQEVGKKLAYKIIYNMEDFNDFVDIPESDRNLDKGLYNRFTTVGRAMINTVINKRLDGVPSAGKEGEPILAIRHIDRRKPINKMRPKQSALDIKRLDNLDYYTLKGIAVAFDRYYESGYDGASLNKHYHNSDDETISLLRELDEEYDFNTSELGANYLYKYLKLFPEDK